MKKINSYAPFIGGASWGFRKLYYKNADINFSCDSRGAFVKTEANL